MKLTRWKALYFFNFLAPLFFACICTSCRQNISDTNSEQAISPNREQPSKLAADTSTLLAQADIFYQLGETYLAAGKKDSSLYYHEQALKLRERAARNDKEMFDSYIKVGKFYSTVNKYAVAEKYYEKAQVFAENSGVPVDDQIAFLLELSYIKTNLKDIPTSISLLNSLIKFVQLHRPKDSKALGNIHLSLCNAYYVDNQFQLAINEAKQAAFYYDMSNDNLRSGIVYTTIGMIYNKMDLNAIALINYRKAIQKHLKWSEPESNQLANVYLQKAVAHQTLGELDSAKYYFEWILKIRRKVYGEKNPFTFGAKLSMAQFYESIHNYDSAAKYAHECLISLVKSFNDHSIQSNPVPNLTELNADLVDGLVSKATILKKLSENKSDKEDLDLSLKTYWLADSVFSLFRRNLKYDDPQLKELEVGRLPYDQMIELAFYLFDRTKNSNYLSKAIGIMERSRAVLLETAVNQAQEYDTIKGDHILHQMEHDLFNQRMEILRQLSLPDLSSTTLDSLNETLLSVDRTFNEWQRKIEKSNPNYFNLKYNQKAVTLDEVQALVKERNSILVEYLWSEEKIYALAIGPHKIETKIILKTDSFNRSFGDFIAQVQATPDEAIKLKNFNQFSQSAFILYQNLIFDLLPKNIDRNRKMNLIISANGPLATFPFEALITQLPQLDDVNYHLPYLIQTYPISYAYSPGILIKQSKHGRDGNKLLALGFAGTGPSRVQRNGLSDLPGTEEEIKSIKEVMKNNTNKYYLEGEASESIFKQKVTEVDIVHLAIHGFADTTSALRSKLVFRSEADTLEDSNLYAHELYSLNLNKLDLAVLSACESGIGKRQAGEGVMSIARGFAYAGCPSLVISLWKIDDRTSAQVIGDFYRHLSNGEELDRALANAKVDYLGRASEFKSHPAFWAAFLQVGDTRAIDVKKYDWKIITTVLFCVLLIIIGFWAKKKRMFET